MDYFPTLSRLASSKKFDFEICSTTCRRDHRDAINRFEKTSRGMDPSSNEFGETLRSIHLRETTCLLRCENNLQISLESE